MKYEVDIGLLFLAVGLVLFITFALFLYADHLNVQEKNKMVSKFDKPVWCNAQSGSLVIVDGLKKNLTYRATGEKVEDCCCKNGVCLCVGKANEIDKKLFPELDGKI